MKNDDDFDDWDFDDLMILIDFEILMIENDSDDDFVFIKTFL